VVAGGDALTTFPWPMIMRKGKPEQKVFFKYKSNLKPIVVSRAGAKPQQKAAFIGGRS
jgi:hypothetical protein